MDLEQAKAKLAEMEAAKAKADQEKADLLKQLDEAKKSGSTGSKADDKKDDKTLNDKVEEERRLKAEKGANEKSLEAALRFNLESDKFIKENQSILPNEVADLFAAANKETFDSEVDKANATKAALIHSFFKVQANLDVLTSSQKSQVEDFLKLSAKGKAEEAHKLYRDVFEPAINMVKQVRKAEQVSKARSGMADSPDYMKNYENKLIAHSRAKFKIGEK